MITQWEIPTVNDGETYAFSETIDLDGSPCEFDFVWNSRGEVWTLSVSRDGVPIVDGVAIVLGLDLFARAPNRPRGALVCLGISISDTPGLTDLGRGARLIYADPG